MTAIVAISLNDAQDTPVAHSFVHKSHSATELVMVDSTSGLFALSRPTISVAKLPSKDRNVRKLRSRTVLPVMETISGNTAEGYVAEPKKIGESIIVSDYIIHNRTSEQGVKDILAFHRGFNTSAIALFNDPYQYDRSNY